MKTIKITLIAIIAILFVAGRSSAQDKSLSAPVNTVINNYLALKNALVTGDGNAAEDKAKALLASLNTVPVAGLSADESALIARLQYDSRHISEVNRVAHQREHFASLSNNLYTLVKKLKINKTVLYRQYCIMNKNYFLSETAKGKDPYMGMDNCSKVTETLPAKN